MDTNGKLNPSNKAHIYLKKGIKKTRFRDGKIKYPVLYAMCLHKNIKLSELATLIGCLDTPHS